MRYARTSWGNGKGDIIRKFYAWDNALQYNNSYEYSAKGNVGQSKEGGYTYTYTYDINDARTGKTGVQYFTDLNQNVVAEASSDGTKTAELVYGSRALARKVDGVWYYYLYNAHGDVIGMTDGDGNVVNSYVYDAWGNVLSETEAVENPIRYAGQYYDAELGQYYLRARYYDPSIGRFISIDAVEGDIAEPLDWNQYVYCRNNPVAYVDLTGMTPWQQASEIIKRNAQAIKNAGAYYGVNPAIIASCIYTEQILNVDWFDSLTDISMFWLDTSIGIGQVKVSTAKMLEDNGYIAPTTFDHSEAYLLDIVYYYNAPGVGLLVADSREEAIAHRLANENENVNYVAAYLKYWQDRWKEAYPEIDGRTAILATLFNQGELRPPHGNPQPNSFGEQAKKEYYYMRDLLGLN